MSLSSCRLLPLVFAATLSAVSALHGAVNEEVAKKLFSAQGTREDFTKLTEDAKKSGASAQLLAEAKLMWGLRHRDTEFLTQILPELETAANDFKKEESAGFRNVAEFRALISYFKALDAASHGDEAGLKEHITEAFWQNPEEAALFAETVTFFRTQAKMAKITVDMNTPLTMSNGASITLNAVRGKNKALLLYFWASWNAPCIELMPDLRKKSAHLGRQGIAVAAMNMESDQAIAQQVREEKGMQDVTWLVEPKTNRFSELLEITKIPRLILLTPEGKVLFNGNPLDPALWTALKKVDAAIQPMAAE
jgi:thiol-disulfide isomerase/thioredoxin